MNWKEIVEIVETRNFDQLKRHEYVQKIYDLRPKNPPVFNGLTPNMYPYMTGEGIYNYIYWSDSWDITHQEIIDLFPPHLNVVSYVNDYQSRSIPNRPHRNIFVYSEHCYNYDSIDIPPKIDLVEQILNFGTDRYRAFHPTIYLYHQYLLSGGKRYLSYFKYLLDPWLTV